MQPESISEQVADTSKLNLDLFKPEKHFNYSLNSKLSLSGNPLKQYYESYQCSVCYEVSLQPVHCQKCKHLYCLECVASQKKIVNTCAFRCQSDFSIAKCQEFTPTFICPYKECSQELLDAKSFLNHYKVCSYFTPQQKQMMANRQDNKCRKGLHQLEFFVGQFSEMSFKTKCSLCDEFILCRSLCRACDEKFCIACRPLVLSRKYCPIGHQLKKIKLNHLQFLCDICSLPPTIVGSFLYDDPQCNFGICNLCYDNLPEQSAILMTANEPEYCMNSNPQSLERSKHLLMIKRSSNSIQCKLCSRIKNCPQVCQTCQDRYCLQCKPFLAYSKTLCKFDHRLKSQIFGEETRLKYGKQCCDRCEKKINEEALVYIDLGCRTFLCQQCINYGILILRARDRLDQNYVCDLGHSLAYHSQLKDYIVRCKICSQFLPLKFFCNSCNPETYFCANCFPGPLTTKKCHFGHDLKKCEGEKLVELSQLYFQFNGQIALKCHFCGKTYPDEFLYECQIQYLHMCRKCYEGN